MKPAPFDYHAPESVDEAIDLLSSFGDEGKALAGGQSFVPLLAMRLTHFPHLVDLNRVSAMAGIERVGDRMRIGAMTRQAAIEQSTEVATLVPLLAAATPLIGHFQIRNRGTIGGSLAHADPASEYPAVALTLGAGFEIQSAEGPRRVAATEFFRSRWTTCLSPEELLVAVDFPVRSPATGYAVEEVARRPGDFALVGVTCAIGVNESGRVEDAAITLFGVADVPWRAAASEDLLRSGEGDLDVVGRAAAEGLRSVDDVHASAAYRRHMSTVLVTRAARRALEEARRG
jgi:carbon-monoxide dehydrogenase medium subunit